MEAITKEEIGIQNSKKIRFNLNTILIGFFLFFLPFTQALTINIFFPLKMSEIFILLYIALNMYKLVEIKLNKHWIFILLFLITILLSLIINMFTAYKYIVDISNVRVSKNFDSILKYFYLLIAFAAMWSTYDAIKVKLGVINFLFWGTTTAAFYCWYISISSTLHVPYLLLPGMDNPPQTIFTSFGEIVRCGTAKEGNFMGFFLLISGILALHFNKKKSAVLYFLTILTTFSTIAIVTSLLFIFLILIYNKKVKIFKRFFIIICLFLITATSFLFSTDIKSIIYNKIFGNEDTVENVNDVYSKYDRLNSSLVGLDILKNNWFFGVGIANYGIHFKHYNILPSFDDTGVKRIPNNIYIELLSETGIFSTLFFLLFIYYLLCICNNNNAIYLKYGLIVSLINFVAFPTYTMLFIWVFFGIIISLFKKNIYYTNKEFSLIKVAS